MGSIASKEDTSSSGALASYQQYLLGERGSASGSGQHTLWAEGGSKTETLGAAAGHRNHRTQQTVDCGALAGTLLAAQPQGITAVIRRYLRETEKSTTDHGANYVALTGIIGTRQIWLWEVVVRGTPLKWWCTDGWD